MMENERFVIKDSMLSDGYVIVDTKKEYTFPVLDSTLNFMFCKALNELYDENQRLNDENEELCKFNIHGLQVVESDVETPLLVVPTELFNKLKKDVGGFMND